MQLIRAYKLLPDEIQRKIKICFCGLNINHIPIQNEIQKSKYPENLIYMGFVSRDEMTNLWKNSDLNVVMSIDEGFGLSMIEGFSFGVPTLTFNDIDAVGDIYNEHSMKLIEKRDDHEIAKKILECINFDWNKNKIIEWSENFSLYYISEQYTKMYRRIIEGY